MNDEIKKRLDEIEKIWLARDENVARLVTSSDLYWLISTLRASLEGQVELEKTLRITEEQSWQRHLHTHVPKEDLKALRSDLAIAIKALEKHSCHNDNIWDVTDGFPCELCETFSKLKRKV